MSQLQESVQNPALSYPPAQDSGAFTSFDWWLWRGSDKVPLPPWWSKERDFFLRRYIKNSIVLSGIAFGRAVELQNTDWKITADEPQFEPLIETYANNLQQIQFEGGFREFMGLWSLDYLIQDNGAFIEIIGAGRVEYKVYEMPDGSVQRIRAMLPLGDPSPFDTPEQAEFKAKQAVTGFAHLDAGQCWRTGNFEFPVIYQNARTGEISLLHRSRVWMRAQFPQPTELGRGIGLCAASRSFLAIDTIESMNIYLHEKVTGNAPEIGLVTGLSIEAVRKAANDGALQADNSGFVFWKGARLIPADVLDGVTPDIKLVGIKGIPDGYNRENEVTLNMYMIAIAFGTDIRDLGFPAQKVGQTKADAEIQDLKTGSRGRADCYRQVETFMNTRYLPKGLTFEFDNPNDAEDRRKAEIQKLRAEMRAIRIQSTELTVPEAREIAQLDGDMPTSIMDDSNVVLSDQNQSFQASPEMENETALDTGATKTLNTYHKELIRLINLYRKGELGKIQFKQDMKALITKQFTLGWRAGAVAVDELDQWQLPTADLELERLIDEEWAYVQEFANAVQAATKAITMADITRRVGIWANQFERLKHRAMLFFGGDKRLMWREGDTLQKCSSCVGLDGQVKTARDWARLNIQPQDRQLICGGWNCECRFEVTQMPLTNLPLPPLGTKVHHHHDDDDYLQLVLGWFNE